MRRGAALALALAALVGACDVDVGSDGGFDLPGGGEAELAGDDVFAIVSEDGTTRLGFDHEEIYVRMSDALLAEIDREMEEGAEEAGEGIAGDIARTVIGGVSRGLRTRMGVDVEGVSAVRWEDGRVVLVGHEDAFDNVRIEDEPVLEKFAEDDVRALARAYADMKADGAPDADAGEAPPGG